MDFDYIEEENSFVKKYFDLEEVLLFQNVHDLQVIRGEDYQYGLYIDKKCYSTSLTPMNAIVVGIIQYKKYVNDKINS